MTKAQKQLLIWLVEREATLQARDAEAGRPIRYVTHQGGDLINYYAEQAARRRAASEAGSRQTGYMGSGGYASHGWRRAGGTVLARLERAGYLHVHAISWGTPQYILTNSGRAAAAEDS